MTSGLPGFFWTLPRRCSVWWKALKRNIFRNVELVERRTWGISAPGRHRDDGRAWRSEVGRHGRDKGVGHLPAGSTKQGAGRARKREHGFNVFQLLKLRG